MKVSELVFSKNGMCIRTSTIMPIIGEKWIEDVVPYDKLPSVSLNLTVTSIEPVIKEGVLTALRFKVSTFSESQPDKISTKIPLVEKDAIQSDRLIPIISMDNEIIPPGIENRLNEHKNWPDYYNTFTRQLYKPGTVPFKIKSIIKERGKIEDKELRNLLVERKICKTKTTGSIGASTVVLRKVTGEIREEGRAEFRKYIWIGKEI